MLSVVCTFMLLPNWHNALWRCQLINVFPRSNLNFSSNVCQVFIFRRTLEKMGHLLPCILRSWHDSLLWGKRVERQSLQPATITPMIQGNRLTLLNLSPATTKSLLSWQSIDQIRLLLLQMCRVKLFSRFDYWTFIFFTHILGFSFSLIFSFV